VHTYKYDLLSVSFIRTLVRVCEYRDVYIDKVQQLFLLLSLVLLVYRRT